MVVENIEKSCLSQHVKEINSVMEHFNSSRHLEQAVGSS
jgi:hypothetical protein